MGRVALSALVLCAAACGSGGGPRASGGGIIAAPVDGGADAGPSVDGGTTVLPDGGPADAGPLGGGDWRQYRYDARGGSGNPGVFAASEAANLTELWKTPVELGQYVYTQAVAAEGLVVYTTAFSGKVIAIDEATGNGRWSRTLNGQISTTCGGPKQTGFWAAAAIVEGVIYAASPDGNLYALRSADGEKVWTAPVADPSAEGHGEFVQSSPAVSTGLGRLYLGVASSAHCDEIAGRIVAVDLATGAVQSRSLVTPGQQGATIWSSIAVAESENRLYATTGNRVGPATDEPYAQAFLALDPATLEVLDHWQNPTALENADFGSSPALADAGGLKLVAATSKDGNLYVLRRDALSRGPVWTARIAVIDSRAPTMGGDPSAGFGSISTPVLAHGLLYAAGGRTAQDEPGSVTAFQPDTGRVVWRRPMPGYVIAPLAAAGEILAAESSSPDGSRSWLTILDAASGEVLRTFPGAIGTFAAPSIAHGLIFWTDAYGHAVALGVPSYRP
jgi:outer membrane protein assembly factor BamB